MLKPVNTQKLKPVQSNQIVIMFMELGVWPVGIDQEQNKMPHRIHRDVLNLYLNDKTDISAIFK